MSCDGNGRSMENMPPKDKEGTLVPPWGEGQVAKQMVQVGEFVFCPSYGHFFFHFYRRF